MAFNNDWKYLLHLEEELCTKLNSINFFAPPSKIVYVYNPIDYAIQLHLEFITKFFKLPKKILFVGMNPGPFGMAQTGVPFGDVITVRDWMRLKGSLGKLPLTHPKKPILGLNCGRTEVSGMRFWGLFWKTLKLTPEEFFKDCFVLNVCPLLFLDANGKNISLSDVTAPIRRQVESFCNEFLMNVLKLMKPEVVVGVGQYATHKIHNIIQLLEAQRMMTIGRFDHSSLKFESPPFSDDNQNSGIADDSTFKQESTEQEVGETKQPLLSPRPAMHHSPNEPPASKNIELCFPLKTELQTQSHDDSESYTTPKLFKLMHPSPANPIANRGWDAIALEQLKEFGILDSLISK